MLLYKIKYTKFGVSQITMKYNTQVNVSIFYLHIAAIVTNKLTFTSVIPYSSDIVPLPTGAHISPDCVRTDLVTGRPIRTAALIDI